MARGYVGTAEMVDAAYGAVAIYLVWSEGQTRDRAGLKALENVGNRDNVPGEGRKSVTWSVMQEGGNVTTERLGNQLPGQQLPIVTNQYVFTRLVTAVALVCSQLLANAID